MELPMNSHRHASDELSEALETILSHADDKEVVTLGIEELLNHSDERDVTIGLVREAVKEAMLDPDAEDTLVAELDALIECYGEDGLAEDVLRFD